MKLRAATLTVALLVLATAVHGCSDTCMNGYCDWNEAGDQEVCKCEAGWEGDNCDTEVPCTLECPSDFYVCRWEREYEWDDSTGEDVVRDYEDCVCADGYGGRDCETRVPPCNLECSQGSCEYNWNDDQTAVSIECMCYVGWEGELCDTETPCDRQCGQNQVCYWDTEWDQANDKDVAVMKCDCDQGFGGPDCMYTLEYGECPNNCRNGECVFNFENADSDMVVLAHCGCYPGYQGDTCDEEKVCDADCPQGTECFFDRDFHAQGPSGEDVRIEGELAVCSCPPDCGQGWCTNFATADGQYLSTGCQCSVGWTDGNNGPCTEQMPCDRECPETHECAFERNDRNEDDAVCQCKCRHGWCEPNSQGDDVCRCEAGFTGRLCEEELSCDLQCEGNTRCEFVETDDNVVRPKCVCEAGFVGRNCIPEPDCPVCENGWCELQFNRDHTEVAAVCVCDRQFTGDLCDTPRECSSQCDGDQVCEFETEYFDDPVTGEYYEYEVEVCRCPPDTVQDGANCRYVPPCDLQCERGMCVNGGRGREDDTPVCRCDAGYSGDLCDVPLECDRQCPDGQYCEWADWFEYEDANGNYVQVDGAVAVCRCDDCGRAGYCEERFSTTGDFIESKCVCERGWDLDQDGMCDIPLECQKDCGDVRQCEFERLDNGNQVEMCVCSCYGGYCPEREDRCVCEPGFTGLLCDEREECTKQCNNGECHHSSSGMKCSCYDGYGGDDCTIELPECDCEPNQGFCYHEIDRESQSATAMCRCRPGFSGPRCDARDNCPKECPGDNNVCVFEYYNGDWHEDGSTDNLNVGDLYPVCRCKPGFGGPECAFRLPECDLRCRDGHCDYRFDPSSSVAVPYCKCSPTSVGDLCEEPKPCELDCGDNAKCMFEWVSENIVRPMCRCLDGFGPEGDCSYECPDCGFNGHCYFSDGGRPACYCDDGVEGDLCDIELECTLDCPENQHCEFQTLWDLDPRVDVPVCACNHGYGGPTEGNCRYELESCDDLDCGRYGWCIHDFIPGAPVAPAVCQCEGGWSGEKCDVPVECELDCPEDQKCVFFGPRHQECICRDDDMNVNDEGKCEYPTRCPLDCGPYGWCEEDDETGEAMCECDDGYTGDRCEQKLECNRECSGNGYCYFDTVEDPATGDELLTRKCRCYPEFFGPDCENSVEEPECDLTCGPGRCVIARPGDEPSAEPQPTCVCPANFYGTACEFECDLDCGEFGACLVNRSRDEDTGEVVVEKVCSCPDSRVGDRCEKECPACRYGYCDIDSDGDAVCACEFPFTGDTCDTQTRCDLPCEAGICHLIKVEDDSSIGEIAMPVCRCEPGYVGDLCETEVPPTCDLDCMNDGECVFVAGSDGSAQSVCRCKPGYTGDLCEEEVECPSDCSGNGRCVITAISSSGEVRHKCECADGFYGPECEFEEGQCSLDCVNGECKTVRVIDDSGTAVTEDICVCRDGWTGTLCDEPLPELERCQASCVNGECKTFLTSFGERIIACVCEAGFAGPSCDEETVPVSGDGGEFSVSADSSLTFEITPPVTSVTMSFSGRVCVYARLGAAPNVANGVFDFETCSSSEVTVSIRDVSRREDRDVSMFVTVDAEQDTTVSMSVDRPDIGDDDDDNTGDDDDSTGDDDDDNTGDDDDSTGDDDDDNTGDDDDSTGDDDDDNTGDDDDDNTGDDDDDDNTGDDDDDHTGDDDDDNTGDDDDDNTGDDDDTTGDDDDDDEDDDDDDLIVGAAQGVAPTISAALVVLAALAL